jgi:tRNA-splicing ligase RtcB
MIEKRNIKKINENVWEIPGNFRSDMKAPARFFADEKMIEEIAKDRSLEQLVNVATLAGLENYALAMPDIHEGYGFPIGGVAAFDAKKGIISPGGIGYDINCGVRLLRSLKKYEEIKESLPKLGKNLFKEIPSGTGRGGRLKLSSRELDQVLTGGAERMVALGYGEKKDLENIESGGRLADADPKLVSSLAKDRGHDQLGTMGGGNHFVEVQRVEKIFDEKAASSLGLFEGQIVVMIHMGSRGLGHQVATDYIREMGIVMPKYGIRLPDRELACVPFNSPEGQNYFRAMSAAANFAFANRQLITWEARKAWRDALGEGAGNLEVVYDVAHNIAKVEEYMIGGKKKEVVVHRKGATRAFPGQPVLIPGSIGTASYVLIGQEKSLSESFGSTCHGAGRRMSRHQVKKEVRGSELKKELEQEGISVNAGSMSGLAEEAPVAYKDVDEVVDIVDKLGLAKKVARLRPVAVVKG